jgi:hypothetical protein
MSKYAQLNEILGPCNFNDKINHGRSLKWWIPVCSILDFYQQRDLWHELTQIPYVRKVIFTDGYVRVHVDNI